MDCKHDMPIKWCADCSGFKDAEQEQKELDNQFIQNLLNFDKS